MKWGIGTLTILLIAALALAACGPAASSGDKTLEITTWKLDAYVDAEGQTVEVLASSEITARFEAGQVAGSAGCNRYMGTYLASGKTLTVEVGGVTMMFCPPEALMEQEMAYLATLNRAATHEIDGDQLVIKDDDGKTILTYSELEPKPLAGPTWELTWYDNGRGGLTTPLAGTEITALFGEDGQLSGSAGCNNYTTSYEAAEADDADKITVGPAASTLMECPEPEGIMEQEFAYLAALTTATKYEIEGDELRLLNAEGLKAAVYTAKTEAAAFALETLQNAEYQTEWTREGTVRLEDGEYQAPAAPGSASEIVIALTEHIAVGELSGQPAATPILFSSGGGSGTFYELHVLVERNGQPYDVAWTQLGDRVQINSVAIEDNQIAVDMVTHGPDDPMCCPTLQVVQTYALQGEELVLTSE
ncbi:MAG: META domain-containing protein [Anaerolineae bacterium]|jgi:heat shock protein HslJ